MKLKYKVLKTDPDNHSITVRYFTDVNDEDSLAIDRLTGTIERNEDGSPVRCQTDYNLTIWETPAPVGQDLHDFIIKCAPVDYFKILNAVKDPDVDTSLSSVEELKNEIFEIDLDQIVPPISNEKFMNSIEELLESIKKKN